MKKRRESVQNLMHNNYNKSYFDDKIFINHPGKNKKAIIQEVTNAYPEESFCFLNEGLLKNNAESINENFLPDNPNKVVSYAVKANPKRRILEILNSAGVTDFDCASTNEVAKVLDVNMNADIYFNNTVKSRSAIKKSSEIGVNHFTAQSKNDVDKILENTCLSVRDNLEIALRLKTHNENAKINLSEKFGNSESEILKMMNYVHEKSDAAIGLSIHTGSQNENPEIFSSSVKQLGNLIKNFDGKDIATINLGGGMPVAYNGERYNMQSYFDVINKAVKENFSGKNLQDTKIIIEPGRAMIAESVDLVVPILSVDEIDGEKSIYMNEGVFTSFSDFAIHGWGYNFKIIKKNGVISDNKVLYKLYGRTCDSGDNLGKVFLPDNLEEGDFIYVEKAGAYMDSQSTHFNGFEPPRYISYNL